MDASAPLPPLPTHFRALAPLGEGAFGRVYRAIDDTGRDLAIKVLDASLAAEAEAVWQFTGEFRRLSRLAHPAFPAAIEAGRTAQGLPYYAMALVGGEPPRGPLAAARVREIIGQVASALAYLHGVGLVHGDLKPDNVHLEGETVRLLDVGMMAPVGQKREVIAGTLEYLAPEGYRKAPTAPAADAYALGALAYALWTGEPPFTGNPAEIVRGHLQLPVPPLAGRTPDADPALEALIRELLEKDPARRAGLGHVLTELGLQAPESSPTAALAYGTFVGREDWLARVTSVLAQAAPAGLALSGPAGVGRTRALEEARLLAQMAGRRWIGTSAGAADAPGSAARAVVRQALHAANHTPDALTAHWLAGTAPADWADLEPASRRQALSAAAATAFSEAIASLDGLAIGLDDWDRADTASREFIGFWWRQAPPEHTLLVVVGASEGLEPWPLAPLTDDEARALLAARLGRPAPESLVQAVLPVAQGLPQLLDLLLEHLAASGRLDDPETSTEAGRLPAGLTALLDARLAALGAPVRRLVEVAAVALPAGALPVPVLAAAAGLDEARLPAALDALLAAGLLTESHGTARLALPALAPAALATVPEETRRHWADALAIALQGDQGPEALPLDRLAAATALALAGTQAGRARALALESAERSLRLAAPREALAVLEALQAPLREGASPDEQWRLAALEAEALRFTDQLAPAAARYEAAAALAGGDPEREAEARLGLAKCRQMQGDYAGARDEVERALAQPIAPAAQARATLTRARLALYQGDSAQALADSRHAAELAEGAEAIRAQALNLWGVLTVQSAPDQAEAGLARLRDALAIGRRIGDLKGVGVTLDNLGNAQLALGDLRAAEEAFKQAGDIHRRLGTHTDALSPDLNTALVLADLGEHAQAATLGRDVARRAAAAGRQFPLAAAKACEAQAAWMAGRPAEAAPLLEEALAIAQRIGNRYLEEHLRLVRLEAFLMTGDLDAARAERTDAATLVAALGHPEGEAKLHLLDAELARHDGTPAAPDGPLPANRAAAHRALQLRAALAEPEAALDAAERALGIAAQWQSPWHQAADAVLQAEAHLRRHERPEAVAMAREALALAVEPPGNPYARARAALLLEAAGERLWAERELTLALVALRSGFQALGQDQRNRWLAVHGLANLAGRLEAAVSPGDSALDPALYAEWTTALGREHTAAGLEDVALAGAMALTGAERGYLLAYDTEGRLHATVSRGVDYEAELEAGFSTSIAERVLFTGEPLYLPDAAADAEWRAAQSIRTLGLRTVIALPLGTPDEILGVLYMDRQALDPLLSPGDVQLLTAFAATAAAAIVRERARDRAEAEAGRLRTLLALTRRLYAAPSDVRRRLFLETAREAVGAERAFWLVPAGDGWTAAAACPEVAFAPSMISRSLLAAVAEQGEAIDVVDVTTDADWNANASLQALGLRTVWCLPTGTGALLYLDTAVVGEATRDKLTLLQAMAEAAAPLLSPG